MKNLLAAGVAAGLLFATVSARAVTINLAAGVVRDNAGNPMTDGSLMFLQSAGPNGTFGNVTDAAFSDDPDDIIIPAVPYGGTFAMDSATAFVPPNSGIHIQAVLFNHGDAGLAAGHKLRLVWFPGLADNAAQPGPGRFYGFYRDAVGVDGSVPWEVPANNAATVDMNMLTVANGGSLAEETTWAVNQTAGINQPPVALCAPNVTTQAGGAACDAVVSASQVDDGSTDPDGEIVSRTLAPGGPYPVGDTLVTLTVQDDTGQTDSCTTTITVTDSPPAIVCPQNIVAEVTAPGTETAVSYNAPVVSDNCDGASVICLPASGSMFSLGATTVTCTATDSGANTASCTFDVTVIQVNNLSPLAVCQDIVVPADAICGATVTPDAVDGGSSDPDGSITNRAITPAGPFTLGDTVVTLTVTDDMGATATCSAVVTVEDQTAPSMTCPSDLDLTIPDGQSSTIVTYTLPVALDNCSAATVSCVPVSGSSFSLGVTTVTCTATDALANSSTCTFTVTVSTGVGDCEGIDDLIGATNLFDLPSKTKKQLKQHLKDASEAEEAGDAHLMRQNLRAFNRDLRALRRDGRLEPAEANPVIQCSKILIAESFVAEM
jgi:hypothetical protein